MPTSASNSASSVAARPQVSPPICKGQKTADKYASLTVTLLKSGGSLCVPEFGGFGGTISYPPARPSVKMQVTSSTTDYDNHRNLGPGPAMFYFQLSIANDTTFEKAFDAGGGFTSAAFKVGQSYSAYGDVVVASIELKHKPCYVVATKGKYGGVLGGLGKLARSEEFPAPATAFLEIYSGKLVSGKC